MQMLFWLVVGHFLGDFSLQTRWMAKYKNPKQGIDPGDLPPGQRPMTVWPYCLTAHAAIMGGTVALATGSIWLGIAEFVTHWIVDFGKCVGWYGIHTDQGTHAVLRGLWWALAGIV